MILYSQSSEVIERMRESQFEVENKFFLKQRNAILLLWSAENSL